MDKVIFGVLVFVMLTVIFLLVGGVQQAKKKGEYLQPDNPVDYGQPDYYENETINPEDEDAA